MPAHTLYTYIDVDMHTLIQNGFLTKTVFHMCTYDSVPEVMVWLLIILLCFFCPQSTVEDVSALKYIVQYVVCVC